MSIYWFWENWFQKRMMVGNKTEQRVKSEDRSKECIGSESERYLQATWLSSLSIWPRRSYSMGQSWKSKGTNGFNWILRRLYKFTSNLNKSVEKWLGASWQYQKPLYASQNWRRRAHSSSIAKNILENLFTPNPAMCGTPTSYGLQFFPHSTYRSLTWKSPYHPSKCLLSAKISNKSSNYLSKIDSLPFTQSPSHQ